MRKLPDRIVTDRLGLRIARPGDTAALFPLFENWNVIRWLTGPRWPVTAASMADYFAKCLGEGADHEEARVIERNGEALGIIGWGYHGEAGDRAAGSNLGYWLGEAFWGKGYMSEAVRVLVAYVFAATDIASIRSGIIEGNDASLRVQEKLGFTIVGRKGGFSNPMQKDVAMLATILTRETYENRLS